MPLYVYKCPKCGKEQEQLHGMNEKPSVKCALGCKGVYCEKLIIGPRQFELKGQGFEKPGKCSHGQATGKHNRGGY